MPPPKPKLAPTKAPLVQQQKPSATRNPPQQQKRPAAPTGQLSLRSGTPNGDVAKPPPAGTAATKGSPATPKTSVKVPHTTWTPVAELKKYIPSGVKSAPAGPPPAAGQPFKWKYPKAPPIK